MMNDPMMMFAYAPDAKDILVSDLFAIMNGTKWPIMGGFNQIYASGVNSNMIVQTTAEFLKNYPTNLYLTRPY